MSETLRDLISRQIELPAGRGPYIEHVIDEGHRPDEPCDICAALAIPPVPAGDERERLAERLAGTGSYDFTVQLVDWGDEYREFMLAQADRLLAAGVRLTEGSNQ